MVTRVLFGQPGGAGFVARVSKPGYDALDPNPENFSLHEQHQTAVPIARGTVVVAANSTAGFAFAPLNGRTPYAVLKSAEGILPVPEVWYTPHTIYPGTFWLSLNPLTGQGTIFNKYSTALTITYAIFAS